MTAIPASLSFTGCPCILFELRMELLIQLKGLHQDVDLAEMHL